MMKRIVSLALVILLVAALFVGCGSSSSGTADGNPEGTYKIKTVNGKGIKEYFGESMGAASDAEINLALSFFGVDSFEDLIVFDLQSGGVLKITMMGVESEGTWKLEGSKITMTMDGEDGEATYKDGEIVVDMDGEEMVLAR